ncbi:MAG: leucine-rich repeat domain-containing protein, partial [Acutalibacteraceae bacterium]
MRTVKNVLKRALSIVMIAAVTLTTVSVAGLKLNASAQALDYLSYEIADGEVTITICNTAAEGSMIIPDQIDGYPVTKINVSAFIDCNLLTSVTVPESITELPQSAFRQCTALTQAILPESLTYIGSYSFYDCKNLRQLNLPESLTYIGDHAFENCSKWYGEIVIPNGVTSIPTFAFGNCTSLKKIDMHDDITYIGTHAFFGSKCKPFVLPAGLKTLDKNAFHWIDVQLPLPDGLETIGDGAFNGATFYDQDGNYAKELVIPGSVKTIGDNAFAAKKLLPISLDKVSISAGVEYISSSAFSTNIGFYEVDEANGYYSSDESGVLFDKDKTELIKAPNNDDSSEYYIPDTVTKIYDKAFLNVSFSKFHIPKSVSEIGYHAFGNSSCSAYLVDEDNQNFANDSYGGLCNKDFTEYISFPRANTTA